MICFLHLHCSTVTFLSMWISQNLLVRLNLDWTSPNGAGSLYSYLNFMSKMRHMSLVQLSILSDVINAIISSASEQDEALAQKYLVRVWTGARSTTTTETFDQLPLENYTSASAGIDSFPPTSSVIKGRNRKGPFLVHTACKLLANIDDPETGLALGRSTLVSFCP